jgi:ankyrin repeat protein
MPTKRVVIWAIWTAAILAIAPVRAAQSDTRLADAVKNADTLAVRSLLLKHVDVNAPGADGMTALHWAAELDEIDVASLLVGAGANPKAVTRYGVTPLALACIRGNARLIDLLLKAGADANAASPEGETPLMAAARVGKVDALELLLDRGADVNARESWKKQSALMWAAGEGHVQAIAVLLARGADIQARSKAGFTPLLFAVRNGHLDAARLLLKRGAQPNDRVEGAGPTQDRYGRRPASGDVPVPTSALGMAVINASYELAGMLLEEGADPNVPDPRGSVLHALAFMRRPGSGNPPLQSGALDSLVLARSLLAHGANANVRIAWKEIAFDRDLSVTKPPPNISVGRNFLSLIGATPFYVAAKHGDVALMRLLVEYGAAPNVPTVQGITPLMAAAGLGFWDGESPGPLTGVPEGESIEAVRLAIELGNDVNAVAEFGGPALEGDGGTLIRRYPLNFMKYDGAHEAPLDVVPPRESLGDMRWNGSTALHGAAMRGSGALVQFLVDHGAKIDARNKLGWTPLMCAEGIFVANTFKDWPETVELIRKLMKERGLDPDRYNQASIGAAAAGAAQQQP